MKRGLERKGNKVPPIGLDGVDPIQQFVPDLNGFEFPFERNPKPESGRKVDAIRIAPRKSIQNGAPVSQWKIPDWQGWLYDETQNLKLPRDYRLYEYKEDLQNDVARMFEQFYEGIELFDSMFGSYLPGARREKRTRGMPDVYMATDEGMKDRATGKSASVLYYTDGNIYVNIQNIAYEVMRHNFFKERKWDADLKGNKSAYIYRATIPGKYFLLGIASMAHETFVDSYLQGSPLTYKRMSDCQTLKEYDSQPVVMFELLAQVGVTTAYLDEIYAKGSAYAKSMHMSDVTVADLLARIDAGWEGLPREWKEEFGLLKQNITQDYALSLEKRKDLEDDDAA